MLVADARASRTHSTIPRTPSHRTIAPRTSQRARRAPVGAHAVARDAAGGVGGVEEGGRKGAVATRTGLVAILPSASGLSLTQGASGMAQNCRAT